MACHVTLRLGVIHAMGDDTTLPSRGLCLSNNRCHPIQTLFPIPSALVRAPPYVLQWRRKVSPAVRVTKKARDVPGLCSAAWRRIAGSLWQRCRLDDTGLG